MKKEKVLLNILQELQDKHGYLSEKTLKKVSKEQNVPIARLYGMARFYTMLKTTKQGKYVIEICGSPSCILHNSRKIEKHIEKKLKIKIGETTKDKKFSFYKTSCIGCCDEAPAMLINQKPYTKLTTKKIDEILSKL